VIVSVLMRAPIRILVVSSVLPIEAGGGELVLRRHLLNLDPDRWTVMLAGRGLAIEELEDWPVFKVAGVPVPSRLMRTRLAFHLNDWILAGRLVSKRLLRRMVDQARPDVLLTIAHGELAPLANWLASDRGVPLVTLFHDWWPDLPYCTARGRRILEKQFHDLYQDSNAALCVCEGMVSEFESQRHSEVLYPIPGPRGDVVKRDWSIVGSRPFRVAYSGSLAGAYGEMVAGLAVELREHVEIEFRFCGPTNGDPRCNNEPGYQGVMPSDRYRKFLLEQDVLLLTMSFEETDRRRARTSFPSKLLEYCQTGLPILIWGPDYCSAGRWARQTDAAQLVKENAPLEVAAALRRLRDEPERLKTLAERSTMAALQEFDASRIQMQFEAALVRAAISTR
jgi:hypothetical protein